MRPDEPTSALPEERAPAAVSPDPADLGPGHTIGHYHILSRLGEGGFGSVFLAEQTQPVRRRVALKVIKPGMDSRAVMARFEAERQALALMDHSGVAKVFDAGMSNAGRPYFVMEYVAGEPITRFCENERLSIDDRVRLMIDVCSAVQHAHMKGVLHRDLKPSNILVELIDGEPVPKIIDFGVAKALRQRLGEATIFTEHGQMIGTPEYMSPEQARGSAVDVDTRADVYSLGAILYELLTGQTPLDSRELRAAGYAGVQRIIEEELPVRPSDRVATAIRSGNPPSRAGDSIALSRRLRGDLDWIVMRCLEKERARRYDSASELARDLERYLADEPVEAGPPSAGYRASKFIRRHRGGVAAGAVVALALFATASALAWGYANAQRLTRIAHAEAAAATQARDEAERVTALLSNILESAAPDEAGPNTTVRQLLDRASLTIGQELQNQPLVEARLRHTIGNAYMSLGIHDDADRHLAAALAIRRRELGPGHIDTLRVVGNVAGLRHHQGRFEESGQLIAEALEAWRKSSDADDPIALGLMNNLAQNYARLGRRTEAMTLQRQVLEAQERRQGPDHPHTLGAMLNLAQMCDDVGEFAEAEGLLQRAADAWHRAHGPDHPGTLMARANIASLYVRTGRPQQAEGIFRQALEARTRVLGPNHPDTVRTQGNLGWTLQRLGRNAEAETTLAAAWTAARSALGEMHADTITIALNLIGLYETLGWPAESADRLPPLIATLRAVSERESATPDELNNCAWLLLTVEPESLRDTQTALHAALRCCEKERKNRGVDLWQYLDTLALAQFRSGSPHSALASQREAISLVPEQQQRYLGEMNERLAQYEAAAR